MSRITAEGHGSDSEANDPAPALHKALPAPGTSQAGARNRSVDRDSHGDGTPQRAPQSETASPDKKHPPRDQSPPANEEKQDDKADDGQPKGPPKKPLYKRPLFWIIVGASILVVGVGVLIWWLAVRYHVTTDDAFITAHSTTVSSRVAGHVIRVYVDDNQDVKKGDVLVELDPTDFQQALAGDQASLASAKAQLTQAQAQVSSAEAQVAQAQADVSSAEASADQAQSDLDRYLNVQSTDARAVSRQQVDQARANARTTAAQLSANRKKVASAESQVNVAQAQIGAAQAAVQKAQSDVENAQLQLSYTRILAADDGQVTNRSVEVGNYVTPGQALMALVPRNVWVTANYKETQLKNLRVGQPVKIHIDAYGIDLPGQVQSIQAGSGAAFSLLPPENATGNYVKVVQRVPVKITFERLPDVKLSPGMSVEPTIDISPR